MSTITLLFSMTANPVSAMIRAATWSRWSHVAIVDGDHVIEAVALHGVRRVPLTEAIARAKNHALVELPCRNYKAIIAAATSQIGKPYDYTAVLGIGLHRDWQSADAWYCAELVAWSYAQANEPLFRAEALRRVTQEHIFMLAPANQPPELVFFSALPKVVRAK